MPVESHVTELEEKHRRLEAEIQQELQHPGSDDLHITELKRQKLRVKEAIERLRPRTTTH